MSARTRLFLIIVILANALGNISLSYGIRKFGDISSYSPLELFSSGVASMANPWVLLGVVLLLLFFVAHTLLLSWADLSYVLLVTSIGYVLVAVLSWQLLDEAITAERWVGTIFITFGVILVGSTPASTSITKA